MSFSRTFGLALHLTILAILSFLPLFTPISLSLIFLFQLLSGFSIIQYFRHAHENEKIEILTLIFLSVGTFAVLLGTTMNLVSKFSIAAHIHTPILNRNVPLEIILLFIGLFAPLYVNAQLSNEKIHYRALLWNICSIAIIYLAILTISLLLTGVTV